MLKLNASYSKKVPVPDQKYSSQSFMACIEVELPSNATQQELDDRVKSTFDLVRNSVERQIEMNGVQPASDQSTARSRGTQPNNSTRPNGTGDAPCTNAQAQFLINLTGSLNAANALANELYGCESVYSLTKKLASDAIQTAQERQKQRQAA